VLCAVCCVQNCVPDDDDDQAIRCCVLCAVCCVHNCVPDDDDDQEFGAVCCVLCAVCCVLCAVCCVRENNPLPPVAARRADVLSAACCGQIAVLKMDPSPPKMQVV
jgi:hypothetical protein